MLFLKKMAQGLFVSMLVVCSLVPVTSFAESTQSKEAVVLPAGKEVHEVTEADNGKEFILSKGQMVRIKLPTTRKLLSDSWNEVQMPNEAILKETLDICHDVVGTKWSLDTTRYWVFEVVGEGSTGLKFAYTKAGSSKEPPLKEFSISLTVKQPNNLVFVDESFNGKEVVMNQGQSLKLAIEGNGSTGYQWKSVQNPDDKILQQVSNYMVRYPMPEDYTGTSSINYWVFSAVGSGSTAIELKYVRPSKTTTQPLKTFSVKVTVQSLGNTISGSIKPDFTYTNNMVNENFNIEIKEQGSNTKKTVKTDQDGAFTYSPIYGQSCTLTISKPGYLKRTIKNVLVGVQTFAANPPIEMWAGDVDGNGAINMDDVSKMVACFNATLGSAKYKEAYDFNRDNAINIEDIMILVKHFNATSSTYPAY